MSSQVHTAEQARVERASRGLPFLGMFLVALGLSLSPKDPLALWPWEVLAFAVFAGAAFQLAVNTRLVIPAAIVAIQVSAYSIGLSDAVRNGIVLNGIAASADGARFALVAQVAFWAFVLGSSRIFLPVAGVIMPIPPSSASFERSMRLGLGILLGISLAAAFRAGTWTAYGGEVADTSTTVGFKWEFFYDSALCSALLLAWMEVLDAWEDGRSPSRLVAVVGTILGILAVFRQVRRLIVVVTIVALVLSLNSPGARDRLLRRPARLVAAMFVLFGVGLAVYFLSEAWRASSQDFNTNDVTARLTDVYSRGFDSSELADSQKARDRFSYLWLDSLTFDMAPTLPGIVALGEILWSTVVVFIPGYMFPAKYLYPQWSCESAFYLIRLDVDLPCTPVSEAYLAQGWSGIAIVAASWGPALALATVLLRKRSTLARIIGAHLMLPMTYVETQAFPFIGATRFALLGGAVVLAFGLAARAFTGGGALGRSGPPIAPKRGARRRVEAPRSDPREAS